MKPVVKQAAVAATLLVALALGYGLGHAQKGAEVLSETGVEAISASAGPAVKNGVVQDASGRPVLYWYDPMVPQQHFDKPGKSPFMDMELVPQYAEADEAAGKAAPAGVTVSATVAQNLGLRLATASQQAFGNVVTAVGRIEQDQHRLYSVQLRAEGFIERLLVRALGDPVRQGQKLAEVYVPELLAAQRELLALEQADLTDTDRLRAAARERLRLLGMSEVEISAMSRRGQAQARIGVYAPANGYVSELGAREGAQLSPGMNLMQIADLASVWLLVELPEREAAKVRIGDRVVARLDSQPGVEQPGQVDYVYPDVEAATRSVRLRIRLANPAGRLRPGMYAEARLSGATRQALAVPSEAVIATGTRSVVIVKDGSRYRPVEIKTGAEQGGRTEILSGLQDGTQVVASGQFLIDSEASLKGVLARLDQGVGDAPAMEAPSAPAAPMPGHNHGGAQP